MNLSDLSCSLNPTWPDWLPETAALPTVLAVAAILILLTLWTYLGTRGARFGRILTVMLLRLAALAVALLVALRPSLGMQVLEGLEPSRLLILIDASESMGITDDFNGLSRWDNACRILASRPVAAALKRLAADEQVEIVYYQAAEGLAEFKPADGAEGKRTDIGTWLHVLYAKHAGQDKLRGVLLFSDGADNGTRYPTLDEARRFKGICPIYTFGHGKPQEDIQRKDIAVAGIRATPSPVPAKTKLTVTGLVQAPGFKDTVVDVSLWIQSSKDKEPRPYGDVEKHQLKDEKNNEIKLTRDAPETPDEYKLTLKVAKVDGEADESNNEASTYLQVTKEGISVLWVEARKSYEPSMALRYALGGDKRIRAYYVEVGPESKTGPARFDLDQRHYDVIVIGDVTARQFDGGDPDLVKMIRDLVRDKKVGLMMRGGIDTFGAGGWGKTLLAEVLPAKFDTDRQIDAPLHDLKVLPVKKGVHVESYPFMMLDPDPEKNLAQWKKLRGLYGMASLGSLDTAPTCWPRRRTSRSWSPGNPAAGCSFSAATRPTRRGAGRARSRPTTASGGRRSSGWRTRTTAPATCGSISRPAASSPAAPIGSTSTSASRANATRKSPAPNSPSSRRAPTIRKSTSAPSPARTANAAPSSPHPRPANTC